jgi:hypothetical protein
MLLLALESDYGQEHAMRSRLLFARGHNRLRPIHVAIATLKFGFRFHGNQLHSDGEAAIPWIQ